MNVILGFVKNAVKSLLLQNFLLFLFAFSVSGQLQEIAPAEDVRFVTNLNSSWKFYQGGFEFGYNFKINDEGWQLVDLPHTWNADDPFDDVDGYYRGPAWYRKQIRIPETLNGRKFHLRFEGANQVSDVYVNGMFAGRHQGGYTAFMVDITEFIHTGDEPNLLAVMVDNAHDPFIPPLSVGFALYGGIYRDVELVVTEPVRFSLADKGSEGIYHQADNVSERSAALGYRVLVDNDLDVPVRASLKATVKDRDSKVVAEQSVEFDAAAGKTTEVAPSSLLINNPHLWSPDDPHLYSVEYNLQSGGKLVDRLSIPLGIRSIRLDPQRGFYLNGEKMFLKGTNRHQDFQGRGSALSNSDHLADLKIIKQMGCNFVRLAHYPQDPAVLRACDSLGLLVWEEIPLVNYMIPDQRFYDNSHEMIREMIRQHYNHPSIIMWGSMNEIFLWGNNARRMRVQDDTVYTGRVRELAVSLDSTIRAEDPSRFTAMAIHGSGDYQEYGITGISDVLGLNLYSGWYSGIFSHFAGTIRKSHERYPDQAIFVSEYGAGSDSRLNAIDPERFDFSVQYSQLFHESYLEQMQQMDQLTGAAIWNQFDFSQPWTGGSIPHVNQKGMYTWDRKPKDVYYLYKANWSDEPFVYIASREWTVRSGTANAKGVLENQPVKVYTNASKTELFVNGRSMGRKKTDAVGKAVWMTDLKAGKNEIEVRSVGAKERLTDRLEVVTRLLPENLQSMDPSAVDIGVNCGSNAQYHREGALVWQHDKPYTPGSYGYTGGERVMLQKDIALTNTNDPALFFQYLDSPDQYRFDLPDGAYTVQVFYAEPETEGRVFEIICGDAPPVRVSTAGRNPLSTKKEVVTCSVAAENGSGVVIRFRPVTGSPVISALRIFADTTMHESSAAKADSPLFHISIGTDHLQLTSFRESPETVYARISHARTGEVLTAGAMHASAIEDGTKYLLRDLQPELWSPATPVLYALEIFSDKNYSNVLQRSRVGFRSMETREGKLWLNNKPVFLRGIAINPPGRGIPTEVERSREFAMEYVRFMKRLNVNIIRIPDDHTWYDVCDELGMMVYGGNYSSRVNGLHPPMPEDYDASVLWYKEQKLGPLSYHPSLVIYALTNEVPYTGLRAQQWLSFLNTAYPAVRQWDPNKLVIGNAGYGYGQSGDIMDAHRYWGWYYSSPYTFLHLRDYDSITFPGREQPITFTECVGNYTGPDGRYNLTPAHKNPVSQMCWTGHASQDDQAQLADRHQAKTLRYATELFRRLRPVNPELSGVFPFTILFYNWHTIEEFADMDPKPATAQVRTSYQPVLLSWESWSFNNYAGSGLKLFAHIVNDADDFSDLPGGQIEVELRDGSEKTWLRTHVSYPEVPYYGTRRIPVTLQLPAHLPSGRYYVVGTAVSGDRVISENREEIFVADSLFVMGGSGSGQATEESSKAAVQLFDPTGQSAPAFSQLQKNFSTTNLLSVPESTHLLVLGEGSAAALDTERIGTIQKFIELGGRVLVLRQEPGSEKLLNRFLPASVSFPTMDVDDPQYPPPLRPSGNGYNINPEKGEHPVFDGIARFMLERWSDPDGWDESLPGMPAIAPVTGGFVLNDKQDMGITSILANYSVGLEGIALAEFGADESRIMVCGFDLCSRTAVDPVAARMLTNILGYMNSGSQVPLHRHVVSAIQWGDYDSENGLLTGIYSGLMLNSSPKLTGSYRDKEVVVNELGHQFAEKPGGWNNRAGIQYVPNGRRVFGPYHHDGFGGVARPSNDGSAPGRGAFWCTVAPGTNSISNKVWNPSEVPLKIRIYCNEVLIGTTEIGPNEVEIIEDRFEADETLLKIGFEADRRLVLVETVFRVQQ
jgi:beta-galactosidase